ncbi:hypothetical protein RhiirA4_442055 [Rhizophagus irregularis]|uniref:RCK N-terminal domain-containing protein n=1 Tax=Rhizophagus irregularis TaxID=588596 RepID=A0A2I1G7H3_9GLOM|nr:hypothetical protein RhiirA4_442055 [Rhizophagus irregularis]
MKSKNYLFVDNQRSYQSPSSSVIANERDEAWVKNQREFIYKSGKRASIRKRLAFQCDTSRIGRIWELFDAILSAMFVFLYIWNTRYVKLDSSEEAFPFILQTADFILATLILIQYIPHIWLDKEPFQYTFNIFSILTWISVFPVIAAYILTIFDDVMDNTYMGAGILVYIYPIRFARLHWAVQIVFAPVKSSLFKLSKVMRKGIRLVTAILFTFLTVTAFIHLVTFKQSENKVDENISFSDAFFFTVLSSTNGMSTDLIPDSAFTRAVILYVMLAGALYIPTALSELLTLIQERSKYNHSYKGEIYKEHIIVTGDFDSTSLFEFLREFFCLDHGLATMNTYVVIMHPDEPDEEIVEFLEDPAFVTRVQYIKGTPTWRRSLEKIRADTASAAFLLTKKFSKNGDEDDANQIMRALAIKKYNRKLHIYSQVNLPENVPHFDFLAKDVICIDEITMGLMAQSLVIPGFASLVVLLTTSVTDDTVRNLIRSAKKKPELNWAIEYVRGIKHEIYAVTFSEAFIGKTFLECSELIYSRLGAVLFSIGIYRFTKGCFPNSQLGSDTSPFQIFLNPRNYKIKGNEIGFVICDNAEVTAKMATFNENSRRWYDVTYIAKSAHNLFNRGNRNSKSSKLKSTAPLRPFTQVKIDADDEDDLSDLEDPDIPLIPLCNVKSDEEILRKNLKKAAANIIESEDHEIKDITDHIIICDQSKDFPENLDIFISVLREKNSTCRDMPVIILSNGKPSDTQKRVLKEFGQVYIIKGSPLRRRDLVRVKVNYAKKCVVLSDSSNSEKLYTNADAASLMVALNIESLTNDCYVLVECIYRETFKMIGESDSVKNNEEDYIQALMRPSFMAGNVFTPSNLDTMLCQCFYNRHIPLIMKCLVFSHEIDDKMISPKIERQLNHEWEDLRVDSGHLFCVDVPSHHIGNTYNDLYSYLIKEHQAVPLGLYRCVTHRSGPHNYIYVNPDWDTIVNNSDKVYLIASKLPKFTSNSTE